MNDNDMIFGPAASSSRAGTAASSGETPAAAAEPVAEYRHEGDKSIWGIYGFLCLVSIIELYSASSREVASAGVYGPILRHCLMLLAGFGIVWGLSRVHYKYFFGLAWLVAIFSIGSMLYVSMFGEIVNGARRHFSLMGITIQPSEFIKLSAVLVIAKIMARSQKPKGVGVINRGIYMSAAVVLLFGALLFKQGLTNTLLLMSISLAMMLIGGTELKKFFLVVGVYILIGAGAVFAKSILKDHFAQPVETSLVAEAPENVAERHGTWKNRLDRFFSSTPKYEEEITATNRQEMYSYMAQANGGFFGVMPGNSRETARLPLAFSDYIYAIILEDIGFLGGTALMLLYLALLVRAGVIARKCHRAFPVLLVVGLAVMIVMQALFHMAITTGTFPVSGQPLPLISKGGTSILVTSIAFGMMLSVSRTAVQNGTKQEVKEELSSLPEDMRANNPVQF